MNNGGITSLEMRAIESILEMGDGYVLDFSNRTFADFFAEQGINIYEDRYCVEGNSKANHLRCFLRNERAPLTGRVLAALLQYRVVVKPDGISDTELASFKATIERLGGTIPAEAAKLRIDLSPTTTEADLLRLVFQKETFAKLPVEPAMNVALVGRMEEAHRCIGADANLAAVILCGSVLEGMCLGFGCSHPERVNRAFGEQYKKPPKKFQDWTLNEWIEVLGRLGDLSPNIEKFGHSLRDFRNYVHPAEQLAHRFTPDRRTAQIGFQVVVAAAEDLVRAEDRLAGTSEVTT